jgi:hypothetical protein
MYTIFSKTKKLLRKCCFYKNITIILYLWLFSIHVWYKHGPFYMKELNHIFILTTKALTLYIHIVAASPMSFNTCQLKSLFLLATFPFTWTHIHSKLHWQWYGGKHIAWWHQSIVIWSSSYILLYPSKSGTYWSSYHLVSVGHTVTLFSLSQ